MDQSSTNGANGLGGVDGDREGAVDGEETRLEHLGRTGTRTGKQVSVTLRQDQVKKIDRLQEEYDLSQSEAVRLAIDMAGPEFGVLGALDARLKEQSERVAELEAQLGDFEDLDKAVAHINKAHPDMPIEIKDIHTMITELRKGEEPPDWFTKYLK